MAYPASQLLTSLLKDVSRSFYLTLRVLPSRIRLQIGLAYLLARLSDTIADTQIVAVERRLLVLRQYKRRVLGEDRGKLDCGDLAAHQGSTSERVLLENTEAVLGLMSRCSPGDLELIRQVLAIIIGGQELDLERFGHASATALVALRDDAELDDYTYRVAGCVGEFWTRICVRHLFSPKPGREAFLLEQGVRFGKGLQLVNVLRDIPADLREGRCYLPFNGLAAAGLEPSDLLDPETESRMRPLYNSWLGKASAHLQAGWAYTNALPRSSVRVRLACAWPVLIGMETIVLLQKQPVLNPAVRLKISRKRVNRIFWRSLLAYPWPYAWQKLPPMVSG